MAIPGFILFLCLRGWAHCTQSHKKIITGEGGRHKDTRQPSGLYSEWLLYTRTLTHTNNCCDVYRKRDKFWGLGSRTRSLLIRNPCRWSAPALRYQPWRQTPRQRRHRARACLDAWPPTWSRLRRRYHRPYQDRRRTRLMSHGGFTFSTTEQALGGPKGQLSSIPGYFEIMWRRPLMKCSLVGGPATSML